MPAAFIPSSFSCSTLRRPATEEVARDLGEKAEARESEESKREDMTRPRLGVSAFLRNQNDVMHRLSRIPSNRVAGALRNACTFEPPCVPRCGHVITKAFEMPKSRGKKRRERTHYPLGMLDGGELACEVLPPLSFPQTPPPQMRGTVRVCVALRMGA